MALIFIAIFLKFSRDILYYSYYWQLKEYRFDRVLDFLHTKKGLKTFFSLSFLINFILILIFPLFIFIDKDIYIYLLLLFFFVGALKVLLELVTKRLKKPIFTLKSILLVGGVFAVEVSILTIFIIYNDFSYFLNLLSPILPSIGKGEHIMASAFYLLVLLIFIPFLVTLGVVILKPVTFLMKKRIINKAKAKIASMPDLKVIGITGSYGKTSTKEFLYTILNQKFKTAKTGEHINVDIGVAQEVLTKVKKDSEVFIVEMGAYKIGEIKSSCDIAKPQIGIITGINQQHLSLFGSQENIIKAKSELVKALPGDGTAILNFDNKFLAELKLKVKTLYYSLKKEKYCYASEIKILPDKLKFRVHLGKEAEDFSVNIQGKHNISNLLGCVIAAHEVGMSLTEINKACRQIKPLEKTLRTLKGVNDSVLIDDSYNANPDGVIEALKFMNVYEDYKKIFVFPGILELGKATKEAHIRVAKKAAEVCDYIFITATDFVKPIKEGLSDFPEENLIIETDQEKILKKLKKLLEKDKSVVLFESRGAEKVISSLKKDEANN